MLSIVTATAIGYVLGGTTMNKLVKQMQKAAAKIYARQIHAGKLTLDDVIPQTEEYREYVKQCYFELYHEQL